MNINTTILGAAVFWQLPNAGLGVALARRVGAVALGTVICYYARYFVSRFEKLNAKALTAVVGILLGVGVGTGVAQLFQDQIALALYPVGLLAGLVAYELMPGTQPAVPGTNADTFLKRIWDRACRVVGLGQPSECKIFIFGLSRSGKSTLIEQVFGASAPLPHTATTTDFHIYSHPVRLSLVPEKLVQISICDYKGQKPSQVLVDPPDFFGSRNDRRINILTFLVDCVPEITDSGGTVLTDDEIVTTYSRGAKKKLQDRASEHEEYLGRPSIEMAFSASLSKRKNLFAVRLLMNKIDLLEDIFSRGYLDGSAAGPLDRLALTLVSPIASKIEKACRDNDIQDFAVGFVSAKTGRNVKETFGPLFEEHSRRFGPRK